MKLAPMLFFRPGDLRHMEWSEVDLDAGEWLIPGYKMKGLRSPNRIDRIIGFPSDNKQSPFYMI